MTLDLRICNEGMSCDDFTLLTVVSSKNMPEVVRNRMTKHEQACAYHRSPIFTQSALDIMVTKVIEQAAEEVVRKHSQKCSKDGCPGTIDPTQKITLRLGCAYSCDQCGQLHWINGKPVLYWKGDRVFPENSQIINENP